MNAGTEALAALLAPFQAQHLLQAQILQAAENGTTPPASTQPTAAPSHFARVTRSPSRWPASSITMKGAMKLIAVASACGRRNKAVKKNSVKPLIASPRHSCNQG